MKKLTDAQKARIKRQVKNGSINPQIELLTLMSEGFEAEEAHKVLKKEILKVQNEGDNKYFPFVFAAMAGFMLGIFGVTNMTWYAIAAAVIALIAYLANQDEPIAVVVGSVVMVFLMPITSSFYFEGRSSFINLEIIIPGLIAGVPAFIIYVILDKMLYNKE